MSARLKIGIVLVVLGPVQWLIGCSGTGTGVQQLPPPPTNDSVIVSAPVRPPVQASGAGGAPMPASTGPDSVVYVSLLPGTVPHGSGVKIEDRAGIGLFEAGLTSGGLDPVSVRASLGDTLRIVASDSAGDSRTIVAVVRRLRPVTTVGTEPAGGQTDVALNAQIKVVFSEPVAPSTVTTQTVELLQNGQPVAGSPMIAPDGFEVTFQPSSGLAALTQYELVVTTGVTNTLGDPLGQETRVTFTTGSQAAGLASLSVSPSFVSMLEGSTVQLIAQPRDTAGNLIALPGPVSWTTDSGHVTVSPTGLLTAGTFRAIDGVTATLQATFARVYPINVVPPSNISIGGSWDWTAQFSYQTGGVTCADTGTYAVTQLGATFTGTNHQVGSCTGPSGTFPDSGSSLVRLGGVAPGALAFSSGIQACDFNGVFSGTAPTTVSGTIPSCGGSATSGTWHAVRRP